ncbi:toll/interleukin-1 receptor domain-containing protein [Zoogloea sp.]|uniref:toll/interleukin-1 receptor domain-containing protein n=1 Tax=Zoogloea sp. TaxID=49181 RepID=UPI00262FAA19|nr:toll/interleukin-1 receptor domain-containing protein [Zoogloea sp.]
MFDFFISYTHADREIAQRVARRLAGYGLQMWLDEAQLHPGDTLGATIQARIGEARTLLVIASAAAAASGWVAREIAFARQLNPPHRVCPLFVEHVETHPLFADHLGIDATDPLRLEPSLLALLDGPREVSAATLRAGLDAVVRETPSVGLVIDACLNGPGVSDTQMDSLTDAPFHPMDFALNALYDLPDGPGRSLIAYHAAYTFPASGAGAWPLERHAASRLPGEDITIALATGRALPVARLDAAIRILAACAPPDDQALSGFIHHNGAALDAAQRAAVIRRLVQPKRPPANFALDAAEAAMNTMTADHPSVQRLWQRWIKDGDFDSDGSLQTRCHAALADGLKGTPNAWQPVADALRDHVRRLARLRDRSSVTRAVAHLRAAAGAGSMLTSVLADQCEAAAGSAEWDGWDAAEEMSIYVYAFARHARTDHDWEAAAHACQDRMRATAALRAAIARNAAAD